MPRDQHRSAVYAAEDQLRSTLEAGGRVDFFGSTLDVPAERHFADLVSIQAYVDSVLRLAPVQERWPDVGPVLVRERAGSSRAHYEPGSGGVIAIPLTGLPGQRWAARETVVLHEVAHHLVWSADDPAHGPRFCGALIRLYQHAISPSAALLLRAGLDSAGVPLTGAEVAA
jgi:putative metallohydrolase (TIGR04338 family)